MNISQLLLSYDAKSGALNDHNNAIAAKAIVEVIQTYFLQWGTLFALTLCCRNNTNCSFYNNLLQQIFNVWDMAEEKFVSLSEKSTLYVGATGRYNLIFTDSYAAFREIDIAYYREANSYNEFYYIFIPNIRDDLLYSELRQIFEYCWNNSVINCSVQSQNAQGEISVYSYFPFQSRMCGYVKPVLINRYNGSAFMNGDIFPPKLNNMHGCVLRVAFWHTPPFIYLETDAKGVGRIAGGIEGRLLLLLAERLNFTIEVKVLSIEGTLRNAVTTQSTVGLDMIKRREVELFLGGFGQSPLLLNAFSNVAGYYQTRQVMAVAKAAYRLTSLEKILGPFKLPIWLLILCAGILCWFLGYPMRKFFNGHNETVQPFLNFLAMLLGMSATHTPRYSHARLLIMTWLCFTLLMRTVYQGMLFSYMHGFIIAPTPKNLEEVVARNFTTVMTVPTSIHVNEVELLNVLPTIRLTSPDRMSAFDYVVKESDRNFVAVGPQDFLDLYRQIHKKFDSFVVLPEYLMNLQITMYLEKRSCFVKKFETDILWMCSTGLMKSFPSMEFRKQHLEKGPQEFDADLNLSDVLAIFAILGFGLCASLLVFILELLSLKLYCSRIRKWVLKVHN